MSQKPWRKILPALLWEFSIQGGMDRKWSFPLPKGKAIPLVEVPGIIPSLVTQKCHKRYQNARVGRIIA